MSFARVTAFAGFAILLLAGIYFFGVQKFSTSNTVAKSEKNAVTNELNPVPYTVANQTTHEKEQLPIKSVDVPNGDSRPKPPLSKTDQRKVAGVTASGPKFQNAETRGSENPCSGGATISLESKSDGKEVFLKWNSVKGAESYDIYISDLDENMIDHFESKSQTYYRSAVRLDPAKSYRWKLIMTLEVGRKCIGTPEMLTSGTATEDNIIPGAKERQRGSGELTCVVAQWTESVPTQGRFLS